MKMKLLTMEKQFKQSKFWFLKGFLFDIHKVAIVIANVTYFARYFIDA